jgi:hypothetical protein
MAKGTNRSALARGRAVTWRSALALAVALSAACAGGGGGGGGGSGGGSGGDPTAYFTGPGSSGSSTSTGGSVVALIELEAPQASPFVVHATVPVPPGTFPRSDGKLPLAIRNADGFVVPTQMQIVSRYPSDDDGADVVEVLGRVDLPAGTTPGERVHYEVVQHTHATGLLPLQSDMVDFLMEPGNALLVAEDVFGNRYELDLLESISHPELHPRLEVLRKGQAAVQFRTYDVMQPTGSSLGAPEGALPHFLGVHAYVTAWAETRALSLDLRVHNGFDGAHGDDAVDDPLGKVYFRYLELWVPKGWTAVADVQDVAAGELYEEGGWTRLPLIAPLEDGRPHVMPHQAQLHRRLAISRTADGALARAIAQDEGLAFCRRGQSPSGGELWSWWNPDTARYFPQRHRLPDLSFLSYANLESQLSDTYWMARTALESGNSGNYAVPSPALGWAHPWGVEYGGMTGGIEVHLYDGVQLAEVGTHEGWLGVRLTHRMNVDRQRFSLYDYEGEPSSIESWVQHGSFDFVDMNFWMTLINGPDPFGFNAAPQYQVQYVTDQGLKPDYEQGLLNYLPYDFQHFIRYTRTPKVLAWLGNDALAKDDLTHAAEIARMSMHHYPNSSNKFHTGSVLFGVKSHVTLYPNNGIEWGRGESWSLDSVAAAYSLGDPKYRERVLPWLEECADLVAQGQVTCSGFIMASYIPQWLGGLYRSRSQPEHTIIENALWGLTESAFRGNDSARTALCEDVVANATRTVIGPIAWSDAMKAPWFLAATAPKEVSQPAYCDGPPPEGVGSGGDGFFSWASFGYGYERTGDNEFLDKAAQMSGNPDLLTGLLAKLNNENCNIETISALLALLQEP